MQCDKRSERECCGSFSKEMSDDDRQDLGIGVLLSTEYDDNVLLTNNLKPNP